MLKFLVIFFVSVSIGVSIFSFSRAFSLFWDSESLRQQIKETLKPKISKLEEENAKINEELAKIQNSLLAIEEEDRILKGQLNSKIEDLKQLQALLDEKEKALASISNKYNERGNENNLLKEKFNAMFLEFVEMKRTLSSVEALKKAIYNLKASSKKNNKIAKISKGLSTNKINNQEQQNSIQDEISYGNRGYLIKDRKNTYAPKLRIRVLTAEE